MPRSVFASVEKSVAESVFHVLKEDVVSPDAFPPYTRSTVDGYALQAEDVYCASAALPAFLRVKGRVMMGETPSCALQKGEAVAIPTGGLLPVGANAVVMLEHAEQLSDEIAVYAPVKQGENMVLRGEEVEQGDVIAHGGDVVSPLMAGVFASVGVEKINIYGKIKVAVLSTGDELVDVAEKAENGKIRDVNTTYLTALFSARGYDVKSKQRVPDDEDLFRKALQSALQKADIVLVSGGSSIGAKDLTEKILSEGEVLLHGLALKPGKPTLIAKFGEKLVFGLPGIPFAAACVFQLICDDVVKRARGEKTSCLYAYAKTNFPSSPGRTTIQPVYIEFDGERYSATPVFLKSAHLYSAVKADGFVLLPEKAEGIYAGERLQVFPFAGKDML